MHMKKNRMKLRRLMAKHDLKCNDVSVMLDRSIRTVRGYCSLTGNDIPDELLEELQAKLNAHTSPATANKVQKG